MNDLLVHLLLFLVIALGIVLIASFYSETQDARALRIVPRRLLVFTFGCAILAAVLIVAQMTVASVT